MKNLRELHLYLGCLFAPILIFFAVTGAWQLFGFHRSMKDHSYEAPRSVVALSQVHVHQRLRGGGDGATVFSFFALAASVGLIATTLLGIVMALKYGRHKKWAVLCIATGVILPVLLLLL
jgi:hypothetical protein